MVTIWNGWKLCKWVLTSLLFGVGAADPLTFGAIVLLISGVAFLAAWLPARRAAQVDPIVALRAE